MQPARPLPALPPCGATPPTLTQRGIRPISAGPHCLVSSAYISVGIASPAVDEGSAGYAAVRVGVLATTKAEGQRIGGAITVDGHWELNERVRRLETSIKEAGV